MKQGTQAYPEARRCAAGTIALIVAAHAAVLARLASLDVVPPPRPLTTLTVQLVAPTARVSLPSAPTQNRVETKPVRAQAKTAAASHPPLLAAHSDAPGAATAAAPAGETVSLAAAPGPTGTIAPASVSAPRFDAAYLANPAPAYPSLSRKLGEQGRVVLHVLVDAGGRASRIEIKSSSAWPRLDQSAQDAVARWKFVPARRGDEAVDAWVLVPIVFNLRS
ncbi:MAG: Ferric siderophore transport system, periplasmic binding protein TonB [Proteobacteria bacterium]|nr:Ferric siderophore transport system, periplasmic binding protein TonB [Pseudomonadota bacterium]